MYKILKPSSFIKSFVVLAILLSFTAFVPDSYVQAHSTLQQTYPPANETLDTPPAKVELWFEDPVVIHSESIVVLDANGTNVQRGHTFVVTEDRRRIITFLKDDLAPGLYTVKFNVIALDGYVVREQFTFLVQASDQANLKKNPELIKAEPGDGDVIRGSTQQIDLWYSEPVEITALGVFGKDSAVLTDEPIQDPADPLHVTVNLRNELSPGTYQVSWYASPKDKTGRQVLSDIQGLYYFSVEEVTTLISSQNTTSFRWFSRFIDLTHIAHWLSFIGLLTLLGGTWFATTISKHAGDRARWRATSHILYGLTVVGLALLWLIRKSELSELPFSDFILLQFSWVPLVQILLLSVGHWLIKDKLQILFFTAAVLLWPFHTGHSTYPRYGDYLAIGMDLIHLISVSVWLGGLLALIILLSKAEDELKSSEVIHSYSKWAFWSMIAIIVSGIGMTLQFVPNFTWGSLMVSDWGKALVLKVIFTLVILALAFWQRRTLQQLPGKAVHLLIRRGRMEMLYAVLILLLATVLIESKPSAADQGVYPQKVTVENLELSVDIEPLQVGANDILLQFSDPNLEEVRVKLFMPPNWKKENKAFGLGNGLYKVTGNLLHGSGTIYMEVEATKKDGQSVTFPIRIVVPGELRLYE
jgi:copper transport protein